MELLKLANWHSLSNKSDRHQLEHIMMELAIPGLGIWPVDRMVGTHSLAADYRFTLCLNNAVGSKFLLGKQVNLIIDSLVIPGIIAQIQGQNYQLVSPLFPLRRLHTQRILRQVTIQGIIKETLKGLIIPLPCRWQIAYPYPAHEMVTQLLENDYQFLQRQLAYHGLLYTWIIRDQQVELLFSDTWPVKTDLITLPYQANRGKSNVHACIYDLTQHVRVQSQEVYLRAHHELTPGIGLTCFHRNHTLLPGMGQRCLYPAGFAGAEWSIKLSRICLESLDAQRNFYFAKTNCCQLQPGSLIEVVGHPVKHLNGLYRIITIHHRMASLAKGYHNSLEMIKADLPYRLPWPAPAKFHSHCLAEVQAIEEEQPTLDNDGCYQVNYCLTTKQGNLSKPLRLVRPACGAGFGMHFPLLQGSQVVLVNVQNNLDTPLILGVLPNLRYPNPVVYHNRYQNILSSWADHQLLIEDHKQASKIQLITASQQAVFEMFVAKKQIRSSLQTKRGQMVLSAGRDFHWRAKCLRQQFAQHRVMVAKDQRITTQKGNITFKAGLSLQFKAQAKMIFNASVLYCNSYNNSLLYSYEKLEIAVTAGKFIANAQNMVIRARRKLEIEAPQKIVIQHGKSQIAIFANGQIRIRAPRVYLYN